MIKVVAFDLVGVLVHEKDVELTEVEERLERMFGDNIDDSTYILEVKRLCKGVSIKSVTEELMRKLYQVGDKNLFKKLKEKYHPVKLVIATNHVSFVKKFIVESFDMSGLDDIFISAEIHKIKSQADFYEYILDKFQLKPEELLFLDDNLRNIEGAEKLGIRTIKVDKRTNLIEDISKQIEMG